MMLFALYIPSRKYNLTVLPELTIVLYTAPINRDLFSNNQFLTIFKSRGTSLSNLWLTQKMKRGNSAMVGYKERLTSNLLYLPLLGGDLKFSVYINIIEPQTALNAFQ